MVSDSIGTALRYRFPMLGYPGAATLALCCSLTANFLVASGHDLQRCFELAALCVVAIVFLAHSGVRAVPAAIGQTRALLLGFFALGLASALSAHSQRHALFEWSSLLLLVATVLIIGQELARDCRRLPCVLQWVGIACALYSLRLLILYAVALSAGFQPDFSVLTAGFSSPRFLNHTQTALLPLLVLLCVHAPRAGAWRKGWFILAAFWWALLFMTEARASLLGLAVGCAAAFALRRSHARRFLTMMAWTAMAGVVLYGLIYILLPLLVGLQPISTPWRVVARTVANPASDRMLLWKLAVELIAGHPWLGVGPQHFAHDGARLYAGAHPHSWILQIALEWGIPALLCALGAIVFAARTLVRGGARIADTDLANQDVLAALQVACAAIFLDGLLSGVIVMPQSQLAIVLVLGIACAWVRMHGEPPRQAEAVVSVASRAVLGGLVAAGLCALIWSVAPDLARHARGAPLTPAELAANPTIQWARMWQAGFF